ncbi:hypothetical protein KCP75_23245 [Salmonella enterica subsp. enterica]|nr:hypothetical protein KCP75_23245 [Salmonella enterica subsp. enterica]
MPGRHCAGDSAADLPRAGCYAYAERTINHNVAVRAQPGSAGWRYPPPRRHGNVKIMAKTKPEAHPAYRQ